MRLYLLFILQIFIARVGLGQTEADYYHYSGLEEFRTGKFTWAIIDLTVSLTLDSTQVKSYLVRAEARFALGDTIGALQDVEAVLADSSNFYPTAYLLRAMLKESLSDFEGAISDYTAVINKTLGAGYHGIFTNRGYARMQVNDLEGAIRDFNTAIFADYNDAWAYGHRGVARIGKGNISMGCDDMRKAKELGLYRFDNLIEEYCQ
jgi:tetratricopeptide (TPR) repeat protein